MDVGKKFFLHRRPRGEGFKITLTGPYLGWEQNFKESTKVICLSHSLVGLVQNYELYVHGSLTNYLLLTQSGPKSVGPTSIFCRPRPVWT